MMPKPKILLKCQKYIDGIVKEVCKIEDEHERARSISSVIAVIMQRSNISFAYGTAILESVKFSGFFDTIMTYLGMIGEGKPPKKTPLWV